MASPGRLMDRWLKRLQFAFSVLTGRPHPLAARGPLGARRLGAFVTVSTVLIALLAAVGGEWISLAQYYYGGSFGEDRGLTDAAVSPVSSTQGTSTSASVRFTNASGVPDGGRIRVTFPAGFTVDSNAASDLEGFDGSDLNATVTAPDSSTALVQLPSSTGIAPAGEVTFVLNRIRNPSVTGTTGVFLLETQTADGTPIDSGLAPAVFIRSSGGGGGGGGGGGFPPSPAPSAPPPSAPPPGTPATGAIGPGGGQITLGGGAGVDGGITVIITPGAFGQTTVNVTVSIQVGAPPGAQAPQGTTLLNKTITIDIEAASGVQAAEIIRLMQDGAVPLAEVIEVRANLTAADLGGRSVNVVGVGRVLENGTVDPVPVTVVNAADAVIAFDVTHLSKFTLYAVTRAGPVPTGPAHQGELGSLGTTLTWTNPPDTRWFQLQVIPFNDDGPVLFITSDPSQAPAAQYVVKPPDRGGSDPNYVMLPDLTYMWRVRTATVTTQPAETDWTAWSNPRLFTTAARSSTTISTVSPEQGATAAGTRPTLTWEDTDRTVYYYEVQVSQNAVFCNTAGCPMLYWEWIHGGETTPRNSYLIPEEFPLRSGATYYWRVRPRVQGDGEPVDWGESSSFKTP